MSQDFKKLFQDPELLGQRTSSRQEELQSRYEMLNEQERAELVGLNIFPNNPRGAHLRKKEILNQITDDEKEELRGLYEQKARQEENTPAVIKLWERVKENDPNVEQVDMGNGKSIEVTVAEEEKVIWTFGLAGCCASVVFTENENGTRNCVMTHYPPAALSQNMDTLGQLIGTSENMKTANIKKAILALPDVWVQNPETGKYEMKTDQKAVDTLTLTIQAKLGVDVDIKLESYSEDLLGGVKDQGTFVVYVPPAGRGDVRYQIGHSTGKLTEK